MKKRYVPIDMSRCAYSKDVFYHDGFEQYGTQFHCMNSSIHYTPLYNGCCLVSYFTPAAFVKSYNGIKYIYYIKSTPTTEKQITRFFSEMGVELPAKKRNNPYEWVAVDVED